MTDLVTLTIDGREVTVPKGLGLVEAALGAGIEIPVFCYEPRLGPPVGACRMCLVEVEGLPKLQAGCTLTAQDGMVVGTAATSEKAASGQHSTLEFILVNHPLDCPVCDKGGECPLQDLTFRYGPGSTRMTFDKLTVDKPIPVSPLIALDRERCILCYRCTRFSEDVAEDAQLIARNRGAHTEIATFAGDPYRAPFSGNVVELCPVGALTSTQYRFRARPWDIQQVPTVCGLCPVGCNTSVTVRDGQAQRVLSRNHPEVDRGWLCDKGRFSYPHVAAPDRIVEPLGRGETGLEAVSWEQSLDRFETLLRQADGHVVTALSGSETMEQAYALATLLRGGAAAHSAVLPESTSPALDAFRLPLAAISEAQLVVVVGDDAVVDRAPAVDLWLRQARRAGAEVVSVGIAGTVATAAGAAEALSALLEPGHELGERLRATERAILIWSGAGGGGGARLAEAAHALGFEGKPGCGAFHLPATPNGRGVSLAWAAAAGGEEADPGHIRLLVVSGDEAAASPAVRALAERADATVAITMFPGIVTGWADLVLPGTSPLEVEGTAINLEGRVQKLRRASLPPVPDPLAWLARLAERFGVGLSPHPSLVFDELAERIGLPEPAEQAALGPRGPYEAPPPATSQPPAPPRAPAESSFVGTLRLSRYRPLFSGPFVERVPELAFQRPDREVALAAEDAARRGIATGDRVDVRSNGTSVSLRARVDRRLVEGVARIAEEHAGDLHQAVEVVKA
jgi:NADH-quinone oxidoreductase subunit G